MRRWWAAIRWDFLLQWRYGFFVAGAAVAVFWIALLSPVDSTNLGLLVPAFVFTNLTITTFYFVAGLVLFEKGEGTLEALVVTPIRVGEYLSARAFTLGVLGIVETGIILAAVYDGPLRVAPLVAAAVGTSLFYTWIGFVLVARYDSITDYLMPSVAYVTLLYLPLVDYFGFFESPLFRLWPTQAFLVLARASVEDVGTADLVYAVGWGTLATALSFALARRSFHRFVVRREGLAS